MCAELQSVTIRPSFMKIGSENVCSIVFVVWILSLIINRLYFSMNYLPYVKWRILLVLLGLCNTFNAYSLSNLISNNIILHNPLLHGPVPDEVLLYYIYLKLLNREFFEEALLIETTVTVHDVLCMLFLPNKSNTEMFVRVLTVHCDQNKSENFCSNIIRSSIW